jgi:hypothetical protein
MEGLLMALLGLSTVPIPILLNCARYLTQHREVTSLTIDAETLYRRMLQPLWQENTSDGALFQQLAQTFTSQLPLIDVAAPADGILVVIDTAVATTIPPPQMHVLLAYMPGLQELGTLLLGKLRQGESVDRQEVCLLLGTASIIQSAYAFDSQVYI